MDLLPTQLLLASANDDYYMIIGISAVVILSYFFNIISKKTNIPSVLMLIVLGVGAQLLFDFADIRVKDFEDNLGILGIVGLIMIVLEATLELELTKEKRPLIIRSFLVALVALVLSSLLCAVAIWQLEVDNFKVALIYAVPISIMSSAIIIPSVGGLADDKKEFMVYESTFSDILGIMFFYFLIGSEEATGAGEVIGDIVLNIIVTIVLAVVISYSLVILLQRLQTGIKLFLLIAVLLLLYSITKLFHLSSLIIVLVFGLCLSNSKLFFFGKLGQYINTEKLKGILHDFHVITLESAFVVRTFFFVIFGYAIDLDGLIANPMSAVIALLLVAILFLVRWVVLKGIVIKDIFPQVFLAPRGLITVLLFFAIPRSYTREYPFESSILLYTILITSIIMTWSLIKNASGLKHVDEEIDEQLEAASGKPIRLLPMLTGSNAQATKKEEKSVSTATEEVTDLLDEVEDEQEKKGLVDEPSEEEEETSEEENTDESHDEDEHPNQETPPE